MTSDIWQVVRRYRPYVALLAAVVAVVVVPTKHDGGTTTASGGGGAAVQGADQSAVPGGETAPTAAGDTIAGGGAGTGSNGAAGGGGAASGGATGGPSGATSDGGSQQASTGAAPTDAGIGSAAALNGPMCDAATGRLKFPTYFREPCVRPWPKGTPNGGATAPGVTADSITVSVVSGGTSADTTPNREQMKQAWRDMFAIWTGTHETYGREIKVVFNDFGSSGAPDETQQRAMAVQVAAQKPFAALVMAAPADVLSRELARRGILSIVSSASWSDYAAFPGLIWGAGGSAEMAECLTAPYMKKLIGKPARWAGEADLQIKTRKFALMYPQTADRGVIDRCFADAGVKPDVTIIYNGDPAGFQQQAPTFVSKLKAEGVTTVLGAAGEFYNLATLTKQATSQRYFPEWVINGQAFDDLDFIIRAFADPAQSSHFFGFGSVPPGTSFAQNWYTRIVDWYYGVNKPSWRNQPVGTVPNNLTMMNLLRILVSGIHMVGPDLTVKNFQAARFAMPAYGGIACGCITVLQERWGPSILPPALGVNSYVPTSDLVEFWWDNTAVGPDSTGLTTGNGLWRYMYKGQRHKLGEFPPGEPPAFDRNNTITTNDTQTLPAADRAAAGPAYKCQARDPHYSTAEAWKPCPVG